MEPQLPPGLDLDQAREQKAEASEGESAQSAHDLVDQLANIKAERAALKKQDDELSRQEEEIGTLMLEMLSQQGSKSIKTDLGVSFSRNSRRHFSVLSEDREHFIDWLDEIGHGDLAQRTVPSKSVMSKFCAEHVDGGGDLPPFVKVYETHKPRLTGINKLAEERASKLG